VTFEEARAQFPVLERYAYLNTGSVGPLARATAEAMVEGVRTELVQGRGGRPYFEAALAAREQLRSVLAREIGVEPSLVALTNSTTQGCNIVLAGLELAPEDEIVTTDVEHFGLLGPVHASGARVRVARIRDLPSACALDAIVAETSPRTRLVALSHVAWTTGHVLPIEALKEAVSAPLLVDGAQSVGAIPVNASPYDFYTVSGQKWLCGPSPTGALYVRDPERLRVGLPGYLSQSSYEPDGAFEPRPGAARFDPQWIAPGDIAALEAAIAAAPDWRFERAVEITRRCHELVADSHKVVTEPGHATLVSFRPRGEAEEVAARLVERGVIVRDLPATGWLRVSCGWWTNEEDLQRLIDGLGDA
jgi:L-cysteine/cystine lyase